MSTVFFFCALIGGTFLVCQFVMSLLGLGHSDAHIDAVPDISDGGELIHDGGLHAESGSDAAAQDHHSSWLFGIISFRTLVAATTFFGLAGMTAHSAGTSVPQQLAIAIVSGLAAMFGVHWLLKTFYRLGQSGTLQITNAIGKTATVYVSIPQLNSGQGKVQLQVQGRLEELPAVTCSEASLAAGSRVTVVGIASGRVLEVEPVRDPTVASA